jgi:undecaprenyl-diphosphatase
VWAALLREGVGGLLARGALSAAVQLLVSFGAVWWALLAFGDLSEGVAEGETRALDEGALALLRRHESPALDGAARVLSLLGSEVVAVLLVTLLAAYAWRRRWGLAISLLAATGGAQLLNNVLKDHFQRPRPAPVLGLVPAQHWSFPSGHAMVAAAFYLFLAGVVWTRLRGRWRVVGAAGLVVLVALIGWSRMYLGVHYLTDVLAGYCAGVGWVAAVFAAPRLLRVGRRWRRA